MSENDRKLKLTKLNKKAGFYKPAFRNFLFWTYLE